MYGRDVENDIADDVSGNFGKLMRSIASGGRDTNRYIYQDSVRKQAQDLYDVI